MPAISASESSIFDYPSVLFRNRSGLAMFLWPTITQALKRLPCYLAIVKRHRPALQNLVGFMSLTGNQHHVAFTSLSQGGADGVAAINLQVTRPSRPLQAHERIIHDRQWILAAGIVR